MKNDEIIDMVQVDLGFDIEKGLSSHIEADRVLFARQAIQAKIEKELAYQVEANEFYARRIEQLAKQAEFLEGKLEEYLYDLDASGHDPKAATPHGTAYLQTRKTKVWEEDLDLVVWAARNDMEHLIQVKKSVSKTDVVKACKEHKQIPPYKEEEKRSMVIRAAKETEK